MNAWELAADGSETVRWGGSHDCQYLGSHDRPHPRSTEPLRGRGGHRVDGSISSSRGPDAAEAAEGAP